MKLTTVSVSTNQEDAVRNSGNCLPVASTDFESGPGPDPTRGDYWESCLAEISALDLPTDRPRPAVLRPAMGSGSCNLGASLSVGVRRLSSEASVDLQIAGLAGFAVLLHRYTAQEKFALGVALPSVPFLPIAVDFSGKPSFPKLLQQLQSAIRLGLKAGAVPAELAAKLDSDPDPSRHSIFQVAFSASTKHSASSPSLAL